MPIRLLLILTLAAACAAAERPEFKLIAHRGGVVDDAHPENSAASLEEAIARGYYMVEVDIRESKDGHLVVQHDEDFRRYYGDARKVSEMTWSEIAQLRSKPGNARPLEFHEYAALCKGRIEVMLDTKPPSHPRAFYEAMEKALRENGLLKNALVIGSPESNEWFRGKARLAVDRKKLQAALDRKEDVARNYFLFEHGRDLDEPALALAKRAGVPVVPSINVFHYADTDHLRAAQADVARMKKAGVIYYQIDSVYDIWLR